MIRRVLSCVLLTLLTACLPGRVKELNKLGQQALAKRGYQQAIAYWTESLTMYPDQPKIFRQRENAQKMLRQVLVYRIYELVDGRNKPISSYLRAWRMGSQLGELGVSQVRVRSIYRDLHKRFAVDEKRLLAKTEHHRYFTALSRMSEMIPGPSLDRARAHVADLLVKYHLDARKKADRARRHALALLHTVAAANFATTDTGLWANARSRRKRVMARLAIDVELNVQSSVGGSHAAYVLGGVRGRLAEVFRVRRGAKLKWHLKVERPRSNVQRTADRRSGRCQVGVRTRPNPKCASLKRQLDYARRDYDRRLPLLDDAKNRCGSSSSGIPGCSSYLNQANRDVDRAKREYRRLEHEVATCPPKLRTPIYRTFIYRVFTETREASVTGRYYLVRGPAGGMSGGTIAATARRTDTFSDGLSCARIPVDHLDLPSIATLQKQADDKLLRRSMISLDQIRRAHAKAQLAGSDEEKARVDSLVRTFLVDPGYRQGFKMLRQQLVGSWGADFGLLTKLLR